MDSEIIGAVIVLLGITVVVFGFLLQALLLHLTTRVFKIEKANYKTALLISVVESLTSTVIGLFAFVVFHLLLKKYYLTKLRKSIGVYAVYKIVAIVLTLVWFLSIRTVVQNFRIEGSAMEPNLHPGQYVIVNKSVYRWLHSPQRGDIIVFEYPRAPDRYFIQRVIGLPGEKVAVRRGKVYVNDQTLDEPYLNRLGSYDWGPQIIAPKEFFVLGDNRNNSSDSHIWGTLPKNKVIGKAWFSYWPPEHWGVIQAPVYFAPK